MRFMVRQAHHERAKGDFGKALTHRAVALTISSVVTPMLDKLPDLATLNRDGHHSLTDALFAAAELRLIAHTLTGIQSAPLPGIPEARQQMEAAGLEYVNDIGRVTTAAEMAQSDEWRPYIDSTRVCCNCEVWMGTEHQSASRGFGKVLCPYCWDSPIIRFDKYRRPDTAAETLFALHSPRPYGPARTSTAAPA